MSIAHLKEEMLLPERELVIEKTLEIQGRLALIASIIEQAGVITLWIFHHQPARATQMRYSNDYITNREQLIDRITEDRVPFLQIGEISIQGRTLSLARSSIRSIGHNPMSYMKLQHFVETGVDLSAIEEIDLDELALGEYEMQEGSQFPDIDPAKEMSVSLHTQEEHQEVLVDPPIRFSLPVREHPADAQYSFYDAVQEKDIVFYIDRVVRHDIWKELSEQTQDESLRKSWKDGGMNDEQISEMLERHWQTMEQVCSRDQDILLLQYETEDDVQLCFHTTDFLNGKPVISKGSSISHIFSSDDEGSVHGRRCLSCMLGTVPKDFNEVTEVELVSWYRRIPGESIEAR